MLLTIQERMVLPGLLPTEANFVTLKIVHDFREALSFSEDDWKEYEIKQDGAKVEWNPDKAKDKDVTIGDTMKGIIIEALKQLDSGNKLHNQHLTLYEKFVE